MADQFVNNLGAPLEAGDVVVVGERQSTLFHTPDSNIPVPEVDLAEQAYDTRVCGIVAEAYSERLAEPDQTPAPELQAGDASAPTPQAPAPEVFEPGRTTVEPGQIGLMVTLGAFAHCKVDAEIAPIRPGDLLTTSPTPGHAQKVLEPERATGALVGKALGSLQQGKGKIPVLVLLR
jgi:hypothetical protein